MIDSGVGAPCSRTAARKSGSMSRVSASGWVSASTRASDSDVGTERTRGTLDPSGSSGAAVDGAPSAASSAATVRTASATWRSSASGFMRSRRSARGQDTTAAASAAISGRSSSACVALRRRSDARRRTMHRSRFSRTFRACRSRSSVRRAMSSVTRWRKGARLIPHLAAAERWPFPSGDWSASPARTSERSCVLIWRGEIPSLSARSSCRPVNTGSPSGSCQSRFGVMATILRNTRRQAAERPSAGHTSSIRASTSRRVNAAAGWSGRADCIWTSGTEWRFACTMRHPGRPCQVMNSERVEAGAKIAIPAPASGHLLLKAPHCRGGPLTASWPPASVPGLACQAFPPSGQGAFTPIHCGGRLPASPPGRSDSLWSLPLECAGRIGRADHTESSGS